MKILHLYGWEIKIIDVSQIGLLLVLNIDLGGYSHSENQVLIE